MKNQITKKLAAMLLSICMVATLTPNVAFIAYAAEDAGGSQSIAVESPESLKEAVATAETGDIVEITAAGTYKIPNLPKNITVKATVDDVVFDCIGGGSIASVPNGATFENVTMNFGANNYHGFQHAGTINMNDCVLNGLFFSYGDMNFKGCTFNAPGTEASGVSGKDYSMWAYGMDLTYTDCTFNGAGKFINVYNEGGQFYSVKASGCTFNSTVANKAAFNVKETCGATVLNRNVEIENCSCTGSFPEAKASDSLVVISPLVQVDDRMAGGTPAGGEVKVTLDGKEVYSSSKVFGEAEDGYYHVTTAAELDKVKALVNGGKGDIKVMLDADIDMSGVTWTDCIGTSTNAFAGTFDGNGKTISNLIISASGAQYVGLFAEVQRPEEPAVIQDLTVKNATVIGQKYVAVIAGHVGNGCIENCKVEGAAVTGEKQVGSIVGYIGNGSIKGCVVTDADVKATVEIAGGIAGRTNADTGYDVSGNTISNSTVQGTPAAALVGQIITNKDSNAYYIKNNTIDNVTVKDANGADAFNPIGVFYSESSFDANAVTGGKIVGNSWAPMTTPNSFKMVNPADATQYIVIKNANQPKVAKIGDKEYSSLQDALNDAVTEKGAVTVEIIADVDMTDTDWTSVNLSTKKDVVTIEGNDHVITGLNERLFGTAWASKGLVINDLTIKDSNIVSDENDSNGSVGVGAFVGYVEATETVTLKNCHVIDSTVCGGHWAGGFVGICGGYNNANDGPVFTTLTITDSTVEGCTVKSKGSVGAIIGHGSTNPATKVILEGSATGNTLVGPSASKTGKLIGTIGAAGPVAFNGEKGDIELSVTESGNTGATNVAGRIGTSGGTMIVTGGSYESDPLVTSDNATGTIAAKEGFKIAEKDGKYTVVELEYPVWINDNKYLTLADAVKAAKSGDVIEITIADTYKLTNLPENVTVKATVDDVIFDCNGSGSIASVPNGATFENVTMNFGASAYHGFQHAGTINMNDCTLNGLFFSYGDMNFDGCTFNAPGSEYSMWAYSGDINYKDCTFNGAGKFINVYNEGADNSFNITAEGCTFNSTKTNKAALNVKETCGSKVLKYNVAINNCTTNENFPAASSSDKLVVISPLVQVDDRLADGTDKGGEIAVALDGKTVYSTVKAYKPAEDGFYHVTNAAELDKVKAFVNGGKSDIKVMLDADIDMSGVTWTDCIGTASSKFNGIFNGQGHKVSNLTINGNQNFTGFFGAVFGASITDLTLENAKVSNTATDYTGALVGSGYAKIENCSIIGGSVSGVEQVGGVIGYLSCGYVKNCTVDGTAVTSSGGRVGGITGKANVDSDYLINGNTVKNTTIKGDTSAALIGQVMTAQDRNKYEIKDNAIIDVKVLDSKGADAFNPIGNFRSGSYDANAVEGGKISGNSWAPTTKPNYYDMKNPADESQYVRIKNTIAAKVAKIGDTTYESLDAAAKAAKSGDVIELLEDDINTGNVSLKAGVTLDGNGYSISGQSAVYIAKEGATVKNVEFKNIHNGSKRQSAVYAEGLAGKAVITDCTFDNCDWDAIQITPVAGAEIVITGNVFKDDAEDGITQQRYVHIQSGKNVDFAAKVNSNKMYGDVAQGALEVYYFADQSQVDLSKNFIETLEDTCILSGNGSNVSEMVLPLYEEDLKTAIDTTAVIKDAYSIATYSTLEGAVKGAKAGDVVTLIKDASGNGIVIDKDVTIDFAGFTYTVGGNLAGSAGTKTQGFQLLKDNNITFKNGTITVADESGAKMLIQNYSNLTLDNVVADGTKLTGNAYTVSNNNGSIRFINETEILAKDGNFAYDLYDWASAGYEGLSLEIADGVKIVGKTEIGGNREVLSIKIKAPETMLPAAIEGYKWVKDSEGFSVLTKKDDFDNLKDLVDELQAQVDELQAQVDANKAVIDALDNTYATDADVAEKIEGANAAIEAAQAAIEAAQKEIDEAQDAQAAENKLALIAAIDAAKDALETADANTLAAAEAYTDTAVKALQDQVDANKAAIDALDNTYATDADVAEKIEAAQAAIKAAQKEIDEAQDAKTAADMAAAIDAAKDALETADADTLAAAKAYTDQIAADIQTSIEALENADVKNKEELTEAINAAKAAADNAQAAINALDDTYATDVDIAGIQGQINALKDETIKALQSKVDELEERVSELERVIPESEEDLEKRVSALEESIRILRGQLCKASLKYTIYTYTGQEKTPIVTVVDAEGNKLVEGTDYTVTMPKEACVKVGTYKVKINLIGEYAGTKVVSFKIRPAKSYIKTITPGTKKLKVTMYSSPARKDASHYQIAYKRKGASEWKYTTTTTYYKTIKSLRSNKRYYVKVRAIKKIGTTTYYGKWTTTRLSEKIK